MHTVPESVTLEQNMQMSNDLFGAYVGERKRLAARTKLQDIMELRSLVPAGMGTLVSNYWHYLKHAAH